MTLTDKQLKAFGKMILECVQEEFKDDKPFWSDEWPERLQECGVDDAGWDDVSEAVEQLLAHFKATL